MSRPIVAVVGRPNVGKSTLFNRIVGRRVSIVEDTPGVTRDRIYAEAEWNGIHFDLIDTGGIEPASSDVILAQMREQAQIAIDMADVILFVTDGKEGITTTDEEVANMLRRTGKKVVLAQPQTFMNLSGESVVQLVNFFKPEADQLIVCYDDVDLPGTAKIAGINSVKSNSFFNPFFFNIRHIIGEIPESPAFETTGMIRENR